VNEEQRFPERFPDRRFPDRRTPGGSEANAPHDAGGEAEAPVPSGTPVESAGPESNPWEGAPTLGELAPPGPPRDPFWGYTELLLFLGMAPAAMVCGFLLGRGVFWILRIKPADPIATLYPQLLGYVLMFGAMAVMFRVFYDRPFWYSLGWRPLRLPFSLIIFAGVVTAVGVVVFASTLIRVSNAPNQMTELMQGRRALILMTIFGVTVAPVAEELVFRGFLQPLLVRSLGPALGILLSALPFGALHYSEYGNSWQHVVLICVAGAAFGAMRQITGSTKAAALMHASYNALFFLFAFYGKDHTN
jgi:membrane protease YdiL (CAAX protease family)